MGSFSRSNHGAYGEDNGTGCKSMAFLDDEHPETRGPHIVSGYSLGDLVCKVIHEGSFQSPLSTHLFVEYFISDPNLIPKNSKKSVATGVPKCPNGLRLLGYM
jgi:hypothetical protein